MLADIYEILKRLEVKRYKLIKHSVKRDTYDISCDGHCKEYHNASLYILFLSFGEYIFRFEFTQINASELENILRALIEHQIWYCKQLRITSANADMCLTAAAVNVKENECISFKDLIYLHDCNNFLKRILYNDIIHQEEVIENDVYCLYSRRKKTAKIVLEIEPDKPCQELTINNVESLDVMRKEIMLRWDEAQKPLISNTGFEQTSGKFIVSSEIMKILCSFLCLSLRGDQILTGCSFITLGDFNKDVLCNYISLYREMDSKFPIDAEGVALGKKYYIKNGVLLSAFNDIKCAAFLQQVPGDTDLDLQSMCINIDCSNTYIESNSIVENDNSPFYDMISGQHTTFDPSSGFISMSLFSTRNGTSISIREHLISFLNKAVGMLVAEKNHHDNEKQHNMLFCL